MNEVENKILQISKYVRFAETLPIEFSSVKIYLGYDTTNRPALSPEAMLYLFTKIRSHVDLWKKVSTQARNQLRELSIIAADVVKNSKGLIRGLKALDPVAQILKTVGESSLEADDFKDANVVLDEATIARLNNLQPYIDVLHNTSLETLGDTIGTDKLITDFRNQSGVLEAKVASKVDKLKNDSSSVIGKEKTVGPMIDAYKEACARITAQLGKGSEVAIAVQEQIEKTLNELTSREADLQKQQRLTYAVGRLFIHLQGLGYAMVDAQSALTHIWITSSETCTRLNNITSNIKSIDTEETLLNFYVSYKLMLNDWTSVKDEASTLYKAL